MPKSKPTINMQDYVDRVVALAPPLTATQRDLIAVSFQSTDVAEDEMIEDDFMTLGEVVNHE